MAGYRDYAGGSEVKCTETLTYSVRSVVHVIVGANAVSKFCNALVCMPVS